ncbi:acyl transferase domain-containing protein [Mycobacterium europaeum]|uniref:Acyl transferase domain-containing protein n=1 Tax=Mycobacterium europaeum TaxID=761804 RepID=A0A0U1DS65_9MYCO|nr:type I polyketide synthase [Mycobacterium europaeum]CQD20060.1 acyl transferase domain-containing protein [Mycobacterium europaeum]
MVVGDITDLFGNETQPTNEPIAVVGMACRTPGGVESPDDLWRLLLDKRDPVREGPFDRWDVDAFYDPDPHTPGRCNTRWAATLDDITGFDAAFFGMSPEEAASTDPQHRLLLEVCWEALEHAGIVPRDVFGTRGGVFVGMSSQDSRVRLSMDYQKIDAYAGTIGNVLSTAAGRVSYFLGLHGPSVGLDTACSSSLVATHLGVQSLRSGESDFVLAGGANIMLTPEFMLSGTRWGMFSPTGRCHAFDARGDGLVRSEGAGIVVLKRLSDAERAGDRILAVIRGSAINQDGRSQGLVHPSEDAQRMVYSAAVAQAGIDPGRVGLVETHGPGTPVGDPIEFRALTPVYGSGVGRCALGSVKSNIGHLESAAGIAGFIKAVLAVGHGVIPPNLHFQQWNPNISPDNTRFFVPTDATDWPVQAPTRLAAVSSFGFSGTNAHIVVEQYPDAVPASAPRSGSAPRPALIPLSATAPEMLGTAALRLRDWLTDSRDRVEFADVLHTLTLRRAHHAARTAVVAESIDELIDQLDRLAAGRAEEDQPGDAARDADADAVWVFSGQGAQWAGMGRRLLDEEPVFAATIAELEPLIAAEAGFSVTETLRDPEVVTDIVRIQASLFAVQVALAQVWRSLGLRPGAVLGHSMGEVSAAVVCGAISRRDGARVICRRAAQLVPLQGTGAMASVDLPPEQVEQELRSVDDVTVAVLSSPRSTVVAGGVDPVRRLVERWQESGLMARFVASDVAGHSPHLDPCRAEMIAALADIRPQTPTVPFYSTVTDDPRHTVVFDGSYWADNLRKPVRFADAVRAAAEDGHAAFLEISAHPVVGHAMTDTLDEINAEALVAHSIRRDSDDLRTMMGQLAQLYRAGVPVDFGRRYAEGSLVSAPVTTWNRIRHWIDLPLPDPARQAGGEVRLPLLGAHTAVPEPGRRQLWHVDVGTGAHPWLADHQVEGVTVLPGAAYCETALAAGIEFFGCETEHLRLSEMRFVRLLPLEEHTTLFTSLDPRGNDTAIVEMLSKGDGDDEWITHATAELRYLPGSTRPEPVDPSAMDATFDEHIDVERYYAQLRSRGYHYGPAFTGLESLRRAADGETLARVCVPPKARTLAGRLNLHPVLLDTSLQALLSSFVGASGGDETWLLFPVRVGSLRVFAPGLSAAACQARLVSASAEGATGTLRLLTEYGAVVAEATDVEFAPTERQRARTGGHQRLFHEIRWKASPLQQPAVARGTWVIVGDGDDPLPSALRGELAAAGAAATLLSAAGPSSSWTAALTIALASATDVVYLPGRSVSAEPMIPQRSRDEVMRLIELARLLSDSVAGMPRLWIVTQGAQAVADDDVPALVHGGVRGIGRVVMYEYPGLRATLVDVEPGAGAAPILLAELFADDTEDEIAWRGEQRWVARLVNHPLDDGTWESRPRRMRRFGDDRIALEIARPGDLDTIGAVARPRREPGPGEIEIRTTAIGLNFADVMHMLDMFPEIHGTTGGLGLECCGIVAEVGPGVDDLRVGDRVMGIHDNTGDTFITLPAEAVIPVPDNITDVQAAGIPAAHLTAWYALTRVGRLTAGERILIHAGTGGVGLAAIDIARSLGAEVLATAGSNRKRDYLRELGVQHVMDSRSLDFVADTLAATGGKGVDMVLNSLAGPALFAGMEVLDLGGRFIEIGTRDIYANSKLGLLALRRNITMAAVDVAMLERERRPLVREMLNELGQEFTAGRLRPPVCTEFPFLGATAALRHMAAAKHIGKLVLTVPQDGEIEVALPSGSRPVIRRGASYIITGGLGGLGLELARWLAAGGAGRIVLNGRSAPSESAGAVLGEIRAGGGQADVVLGDIAEPGVAEQLVAAATAGGLTLSGLLHAATVLDDGAVSQLNAERLERVWRPKVTGAWRLHEATVALALDWFVLFSSAASLHGSPGQGNYSAANDWLDSFARWRRARGLPAQAINWGIWGEAGRATDLARRGYAALSTTDGLRCLEELIDHERTNAGVLVYDPGHLFRTTPGAGDSAFFADLPARSAAESGLVDSDGIEARLRMAPPEERVKLTLGYLRTCIRAILGLSNTSIDSRTALSDLGFDSLTALQLRNRLEADLHIKVPATIVWAYSTAGELADYLLERLNLETPSGVGGQTPADEDIDVVSRRWFRTFASRPAAAMRLYCFPHAGGSASTYLPWSDLLPEHIELYAVQLPGREDRADERPHTDVLALAEQLSSMIAADPDPRPFLFFGHSGGSILAFEAARALWRGHGIAPAVLALSAVPAVDGPGMVELADLVFRSPSPDSLEAMALIPPEIRCEPTLLARARRALGYDYSMYRGYRYTPAQSPLDCDIVVFGGDDDPLCRPEHLDGWAAQTTGSTSTYVYQGDHFYLRNHLPELTGTLIEAATAQLAPMSMGHQTRT